MFLHPTKAARITQNFGENFKHNGKWFYGEIIKGLKFHNGVDYGQNPGEEKTEIICAFPGKVVEVNDKPTGYGKEIRVKFGDLLFIYAHLEKIFVKEGEMVDMGQNIGIMGKTGNSTGIHLHFECRLKNKFFNPTNFMITEDIAQALVEDYKKMTMTEMREVAKSWSDEALKSFETGLKVKTQPQTYRDFKDVISFGRIKNGTEISV